MEAKNLLEYLIENSNEKGFEHIKFSLYNISHKIYGDGKQFSNSKGIYSMIDNRFMDNMKYFLISFKRKLIPAKSNEGKRVLSSAYSNWNSHLSHLRYDVSKPQWNLKRNQSVGA